MQVSTNLADNRDPGVDIRQREHRQQNEWNADVLGIDEAADVARSTRGVQKGSEGHI